MKKIYLFMLFVLLGVYNLFAQGVCNPPVDLMGAVHLPNDENVTLNWSAPADPQQQVLAWSSLATSTTVAGWNTADANYSAVSRFSITDLVHYQGYSLTAVGFIPYVSTDNCTYSIKVWKGGTVNESDTSITAGTLVYEKVITQELTMSSMNVVQLDSSIIVDNTQELWIGIGCQMTGTGHPMRTGTNINVPFRNLYVNNVSGNWFVLTSTYNYAIFGILDKTNNIPSGYNVYRDSQLLTSTPITSLSYVDTLYSNGTYNYDVTALYPNNCESDPVSTTIALIDDTCAMSQFPYVENFDSYPGTTATTVASHILPDCWNYINEGTSYPGLPTIYNSSANAQSGTNLLRFYMTSATAYGNQYAILPPIDNTVQQMSDMKLELDARASSATITFNLAVGVMTDYTDASTFVPVDTISVYGNVYQTFSVDFSNYTGTGKYVTLKAYKGTASNIGYVEDLVLGDQNMLLKPDNLTASNATESTIDLTWRENGTATEWVIEYGGSGFALGTGTTVQVSQSNTTTIVGLLPGKNYDFYVRATDANGNFSNYSRVCSAATACALLSSLPFEENFDSWPGSTSGSTNNLPMCWNHLCIGSTSSTYNGYPIVYNSTTYSNTGANSLRFYSYTSGSTCYGNQYAILPRIDVQAHPINTLQLTFNASRYSTYSATLQVGVMTDPTQDNTFTLVQTISIPSTSPAEYNEYTVSFANYTGQGEYIAIYLPAPSSSYNVAYVDDIILSNITNCVRPSEVTVGQITSTSATVNWIPEGSESNWDFVIVPSGNSLETGIVEALQDTTVTLSDLTPGTSYDVYVRANCGNEISLWTSVISFTTRCLPLTTLPYIENFDTYGTATSSTAAAPGPLPSCWERQCTYTSPYPYISSSQHASGVGALYFYTGSTTYFDLAVSQALDFSAYGNQSLALSFKTLKTSAAYGKLKVGIMTDPDDMSTFMLLKDLYSSDYPNTSVWYEHIVVLPTMHTPFYLAFYQPVGESSYAWVDDVMIDFTPTCSSPSDVSIMDVTGTSAKISWEPAELGVTDYTVEYAVSGTQNWSNPVTVTGTMYRAYGLQPETSYDVRIASVCDYGTAIAAEGAFVTTCLNPESIQVGTGTSSSSYFPCYAAYQYSYSQQIYRADEIGEAMNIQSISFQYGATSESERDIAIYMMHTNENAVDVWLDIANAQKVFEGHVTWSPNTDNSGWNTVVLDAPFQYNGTQNLVLIVDNNSTVTGGTSSKSFKTHTSTTNTSRYVYSSALPAYNNYNPYNMTVDGTGSTSRNNIIFYSCGSATCIAPTAWVEDADDGSVTVDWIPGNLESSWVVEHKLASDTTWISDGVQTAHPYTIVNLDASTDYDIRIKSDCGTETSANWTVLAAHTPCVAITIPYVEDFESYGTPTSSSTTANPGLFPTCWMAHSNYTSPRPYIYSTQHFDGLASLYMYGTSAYYCYAVLPPMESSVQMDSLRIKFYAYKSSAAYYIEVGIMTNPNDRSTFERVGVFAPSETSTWEMAIINTSEYRGNGRYIAFRTPETTSSTIYLDAIDIQYISRCSFVDDIRAVDVQNHEATITWTPRGSETNWNYVYGLKDSVDVENALPTNTTTNTATLTNLLSYTEYDIFVQAACDDGENSDWMKYTFSTLCDPINSLPLTENFDSYTVTGSAYFVDCWTRINTQSTTYDYPYLSGTYPNSAPYGLYFYSTSPAYSLAATHAFDTSIPLNTLQVKFSMRVANLSNNILVGVMDNPNDVSTFVAVDTIYNDTISKHRSHTVSLASYTGTGKHLAFQAFGQIYFDDLFVEAIPSCQNPSNLVFSNIATTTATLSWTPGGGDSSWEVYVVPAGTTLMGATPLIVTTPSINLTNLNSASEYDVYLRGVCQGNSGFTGFVQTTFVTDCEPIHQLPWTEDFDNMIGTTTGTVNNLPLCWNYINSGGTSYTTYNGYPIVYSTTSLAYSTPNSLRFYAGTASTYYADQYAILPEIDTVAHPINTLQLSFMAKKYSTSYEEMTLLVGVILDPADPTTFVSVDTVHVTNYTDYERYVVYLTGYNDVVGKRIAILAPVPSTGINGGNIDNIELSLAPTCLRVTEVALTHAEPNALTLTWTPSGNENDWIVQYKPASDSVWLEENASTIPFVLQGLTSNTTYDIRILANCGSGNVSDPSNVITATTDCDPMTALPYNVDFDNYNHTSNSTSGDPNVPSCWHIYNIGTSYSNYPAVYYGSSYAQSGLYSLRYYVSTATAYKSQYAVLPAIDNNTSPVSGLKLSFDVRASSISTTYLSFTVVVGVMSDYMDESTFETVDSLVITTDEYESHSVFFNEYTGNGKYVAIKAPKINYLNAGYIDNIVLDIAPSCLPIRSAEVTTITSTSVDLSWVPNGTETSWNIQYKPENDSVWSSTTSATTTASITGLQPNTTYEFQIQSGCISDWSSSLLATTECADMSTLPYNENFENWPGAASRTTNYMPDCWHQINFGTNSSYAGCPTIYSSSTYAQGIGTKSLSFYTTTASTVSEQYAVLPSIDVTIHPINTLQLSFGSRSYSTSYSSVIVVGVMSDITDVNTFEVIDTIINNGTTYVKDTIRFGAYAGTGKYIVIMAPKTSTTNAFFIDNVVLDLAPCEAPASLTVSNITPTAAAATWTDNGAGAWNVQYKAANGEWSIAVPVTTPTYNLINLTPNTQYEVRVQTDCGGGNASNWATTYFTTSACSVPTALTVSNITDFTANATWTAGSGETDWDFEFKPTADADWNITIPVHTTPAYMMSALAPATSYDVRVRATCGVEHSDWTSVQTFTTTNVNCFAPTNLTASQETENSVVLSWTENGTATSWTVNYKADNVSVWSTATTTDNPLTLTGLLSGTVYSAYVVSNCSGNVSDVSNLITFTTLSEGSGIEAYELSTALYPNPNNGQFTIRNAQFTITSVNVYDAYGKLLKTVEVNGNEAVINATSLANGIYFARISTEKGMVTKSFIKK